MILIYAVLTLLLTVIGILLVYLKVDEMVRQKQYEDWSVKTKEM